MNHQPMSGGEVKKMCSGADKSPECAPSDGNGSTMMKDMMTMMPKGKGAKK